MKARVYWRPEWGEENTTGVISEEGWRMSKQDAAGVFVSMNFMMAVAELICNGLLLCRSCKKRRNEYQGKVVKNDIPGAQLSGRALC